MTSAVSPLAALVPALTKCAGCHDQCLTVTAEAAATGDQTMVVSRVATLGLRLIEGSTDWSDETCAALFHGSNDGIQDEVCVFQPEGHVIEPYLRALRSEAVSRGFAPSHVLSARDVIRRTGNAFGVALPATDGSGTKDAVLLHDAATAVHNADAVPATKGLLGRAGLDVGEAWIESSGALEADLGLVDEAYAATQKLIEAIKAASPSKVVSSDPVLVARARALEDELGSISVVHIAEVLAASDVTFAGRSIKVAVHDPGALARTLDASAGVRHVLKRVAGLELREPVNSGRLATSDGVVGPPADERIAVTIAGRRMEELARTGADVIVTSSPHSLANLRRVRHELPVEDMSVFLGGLEARA